MLSFQQLKRNLKKETAAFRQLRISVLAENSGQLLVQALKGYGIAYSYDLIISECGYDEVGLQVFEPQSQLHTTAADYILLVPSVRKLQKKFYAAAAAEKSAFAEQHIAYLGDIAAALGRHSSAKLIFANYPELNDAVFGNYAAKTDQSFLFQLRRINVELMRLSQQIPNLFVNDVLALQNRLGSSFMTDNKFYISADMAFSLDFLPHFAKNTLDIIRSLEGRINKCLIMDLDNTMWGGIIGDDGIENIQVGDLGIGKAFTELQQWAKQLKERGIILAVCSKNSEDAAGAPFEKHPDMVLRKDDFAVFIANWETKVDNIRHIRSVLNIGFDAMVFIDDNPFERDMIRQNIPGITVPELPEDPADYLPFLQSLNLFETASFTEEDSIRTQQYQEEAKRTVFQRSFASEGDYLGGLGMTAITEGFTKFNIPRVSQLTQRSNQFNLRTRRYSEKEAEQLSASANHTCLAFSLSDKFGDHGLIAIVILEKKAGELFIDTWLMSCRVLKRGMEHFVLNAVMEAAQRSGCTRVTGEYIPTAKNGIVENHYKDLGFRPENGLWVMDVQTFSPARTYIQTAEKQLK